MLAIRLDPTIRLSLFFPTFLAFLDSVYARDNPSEYESSDDCIDFFNTPLSEGSFGTVAEHYDSSLLILIVLDGKLSFGTTTERRLFSIVALTLLKERFSGRMMLRENGP